MFATSFFCPFFLLQLTFACIYACIDCAEGSNCLMVCRFKTMIYHCCYGIDSSSRLNVHAKAHEKSNYYLRWTFKHSAFCLFRDCEQTLDTFVQTRFFFLSTFLFFFTSFLDFTSNSNYTVNIFKCYRLHALETTLAHLGATDHRRGIVGTFLWREREIRAHTCDEESACVYAGTRNVLHTGLWRKIILLAYMCARGQHDHENTNTLPR